MLKKTRPKSQQGMYQKAWKNKIVMWERVTPVLKED